KNGQIYYPPRVNELRQSQGSYFVYTGANVDGTIVLDSMNKPAGNCSDFTSNARPLLGYGGDSNDGTWVWTAGLGQYCNESFPVYCFGIDTANPVTITPATGRHVFLSSGKFTPSAGIGAADSLCRTEAASATLPNAMRFQAMLATTTASA